jgi:FKBP-type peptidyl-prolyl cis-trans isomerase
MRRLAAVLIATLALAACADPRAAQNQRMADAFLAANGKTPGVITLPSGLEYAVAHNGPPGGLSPRPTDQVLVLYEGRLLDGTVFDSSYKRGKPDVMTVNQLIPAWTEALQKMKPGDQWILFCPPSLAYGPRGAGPIPPNSLLIFKLELLQILPADLSVGKG